MKTQCFLIRTRDNAIFEAELHDRLGLYRVRWIPRRWWQLKGRFRRSGEQWIPDDECEYELVHRDYVISGCQIMQERGEL